MAEFRILGEAPLSAHDAKVGDENWRVPEETPVAFIYNRRNYAVMLATPADLEDFAVGFSLTERVVDRISDISAVDIHHSDRGVELQFSISAATLERLDIRQQRRNLVGRAGCGLCGLENAETFFETLPKVSETPIRVKPDALERAVSDLNRHQQLNTETRSVHAAAWSTFSGEVVLVREDIGRHNALDKLLGALVRKDIDLANGFVLMTSRCSYEIVEKAVRLGVRVVASISAPTAFAIRKAAEANLSLYARSRDGVLRVE